MSTAMHFAGAAEAAPSRAPALHRLLQTLLRALDRLAPVRHPGDYAAPPAEWYRYPPY